ncbi:hypothetical protein [Bradyrhizobium sp. 1(2017)]|uniref:hypothetical protein n=1 Tax=Bradyrhizobium sp. 1(2017) TaxID=1404888 RepID=UPI00140F3D95|nr:hypothetical protein [Bradyrhizobium sp. 1(2017)]QIO34648.1 hypothetical protein HAP40_23980 [Bradyrhizobium sp. 1(2017)]
MRISAIAVVCTVLGGCVITSESAEPYVAGYTADELRELTQTEKSILAKEFSKSLKDPDSAKFEWTKVPKNWSGKSILDYCATLNAKNSYGGYVGLQPFVGRITIAGGKISGGSITGLASNAGERQIVTEMCAKKGLDPSPRV